MPAATVGEDYERVEVRSGAELRAWLVRIMAGLRADAAVLPEDPAVVVKRELRGSFPARTLLDAIGAIDYGNAMVPRGEPSTDQWQEHVDGKPNYNPPILPKAPARVAVSLWLTDGRRANANCVDFANSSQAAKAGYVQTVAPNGAGTTPGFLGYMFWAAECPSARNVCTTPPNSCEGGMGAGAEAFDIPLPLDFSKLRAE